MQGQFVIEYCGEVISNEVCRKRLEDAPAEDNFYYITLDKYIIPSYYTTNILKGMNV